MNKLSILLPVFILFTTWLVSCGRKSYVQLPIICTASPTGDTIELEYNKPLAVFTSCTNPVQSTLTTVMDSRCPVDVDCIWAGKLSVILNMNNEFNIMLEPGVKKDSVYHDTHYSFTLVDVVPHPSSQPPVSVNDQRAIIRIIKQ